MTENAHARRRVAGRRAALLGAAGFAAVPFAARTQNAPSPLPSSAPHTAPSAPVPSAPAPTPLPTATAAAPVKPAVAAIDATKSYYVFFDQVIDYPAMLAMRKQLATLVEAGVSEITLVITSGGGLVEPAMLTYSFIRALPARINTHGQRLVASAANLLFLAGQARSADHDTTFMFHPTSYVLSGTQTDQQIEDRATITASLEKVENDIYRERTLMTDQDITKLHAGQVIYDAVGARTSGIVQSVGDLRIPGGQRAKILFLE